MLKAPDTYEIRDTVTKKPVELKIKDGQVAVVKEPEPSDDEEAE